MYEVRWHHSADSSDSTLATFRTLRAAQAEVRWVMKRVLAEMGKPDHSLIDPNYRGYRWGDLCIGCYVEKAAQQAAA